MTKIKVKELLMNMRTSENEAPVNYLLGLLDMLSDEEFITKLEQLNITDENIEQFLIKQIEKVRIQEENSDSFIPLNKMFCYGRTGNTIHMHLISKDLRGLKNELGDEAFYKFFKDQLEDFLFKLQEILKNDSSIESLFAVSPIFYNSNIALLHEELGFDKVIEIDLSNTEDGMSSENKKHFLEMFNKDDKHNRRVFYTHMSREKLLESVFRQIPEDEKSIIDD